VTEQPRKIHFFLFPEVLKYLNLDPEEAVKRSIESQIVGPRRSEQRVCLDKAEAIWSLGDVRYIYT
jgi:hypothetical protein